MSQAQSNLSVTPCLRGEIGPAPLGARWIDLHEAARRMGLASADVVRRYQVRAWHEAGFARHEKPDGGGKARWVVREDADPRLARVKQPEQLGADVLKNLTDAQRAIVNDRLGLVRQWEEQRSAGVTLGLSEAKITASFLDRLLIDQGRRLSRATLFNWLAGYRREGVAGLCDDRWKARATDEPASDPFLEEVKRLYLSLRRPKLTVCHEIACLKADEQGWEKRSYKACQRFIELIPRSVILKFRFGEEAHTNDAAPFIERDYTTLAANEIFCGDHHQFDVICADGGKLIRPWLTAWQDVRSRKIVGWMIFAHDPNQDTILQAFRAAVLSHGVPESVYIDNGKDYDSYALQGMTKMQRRRRRLSFDGQHVAGVFTQLGVGVSHCQTYHGQSKPIERFFGTLEDRFGRTWETYCGNCPANKPEDLEANLKAGKAPALADFIAAFAAWLENDYHARGHDGDGMEGQSPNQIYAETLASKRTAPADLVDLLLLRPTRPVKVNQNGVSWDGLRYGQFEPALHAIIGQSVTLRVDPSDITRVSVWTLEGRFVCLAPANTRVPFNADQQTKRAAIAEVRRMRKLDQQHRQIRPRLTEDLTDAMIRAAARRNDAAGTSRPDPGLPPPSLTPVRSPLEEQLPAIRRAYERPRIAVGAESLLDPFRYESHREDQAEPASPLGDVTDYLRYRREDRDE